MRFKAIIRACLSVVFAATVLFTVSVKEVHYLFAQHETAHEHCDNHLHAGDNHDECAVCKFDISCFTDVIHLIHPPRNTVYFTVIKAEFISNYRSPAFAHKSPRGPPSLV